MLFVVEKKTNLEGWKPSYARKEALAGRTPLLGKGNPKGAALAKWGYDVVLQAYREYKS